MDHAPRCMDLLAMAVICNHDEKHGNCGQNYDVFVKVKMPIETAFKIILENNVTAYCLDCKPTPI